MALEESLREFYALNPGVQDIFYATTPPSPILKILRSGGIRLGNLTLSVRPHVFISPPHVMDRLKAEGHLDSHFLLAQNQGSVLLTGGGNPRQIQSVKDLMQDDVRLFISHPETENVSYQGYRETLEGLAGRMNLPADEFSRRVFGRTLVTGDCIHHREAPEAVAAGRARCGHCLLPSGVAV